MAVRLIHANGVAVLVDEAKANGLLGRGFSKPAPAAPNKQQEPKKPAARRRAK